MQIITAIDAYFYHLLLLLQKLNYEACQCKQTLLYLFILAKYSKHMFSLVLDQYLEDTKCALYYPYMNTSGCRCLTTFHHSSM